MVKDKNMINVESEAGKFFENDSSAMISYNTVIKRLVEVATTKELQDDLGASYCLKFKCKGLSIRFQSCFALSNDSKTIQVCRKTS